MFTLPDKLPHDDQLPALEYVFHLATLIEPFEDFYGSPIIGAVYLTLQYFCNQKRIEEVG